MSIAVSNQNWNSGNSLTSLDCTIGTPGTPDIIYGAILFTNGPTINSIVTDRGSTVSLIAQVSDSGPNWNVAHYASLGVAGSGAERWVVTYSANVATSIHLADITSGQLSLPSGSNIAGQYQSSPGTGTGAVSSGNVTPSSQPGLLIGYTAPNVGGNTSCAADTGAGFNSTQASNFAADDSTKFWAMEHQRLTSVSAKATTFTIGTNKGMITVAAFFLELTSGCPIQAKLNQSAGFGIGAKSIAMMRTAAGLLISEKRKIFLPKFVQVAHGT